MVIKTKSLMALVVLLMLFSSCKGWRGYQHGSEIVFHGLRFVDYCQTRDIVHRDQFAESNPLLRDADEGQIALFFIATSILHLWISYCLPEEYRDIWQWFNIGYALSVVTVNHTHGVKPMPPWQ
jgi:hypothetical protein